MPIVEDILTSTQKKLLPFVSTYKPQFVLVGGTSLALQLGHRRSIDFDLFAFHPFNTQQILQEVTTAKILQKVLVNGHNELTLLAGDVKFTWYFYQYSIDGSIDCKFARIPEMRTIGAMKLFALGGRAKWKDYVDLYFLLHQYSLEDLLLQAKKLFTAAFNEKLARVQLSYYDDVNYSEAVEYMPNFAVEDNEIKRFLTKISVS